MPEQPGRLSRATILKIAAWLIVLGIAFGSLVLPALKGRVLLDSQAQGCLPWHVYLSSTRDGLALRPGDLVVFDTPKMKAIDPTNAYSKLKMVAAVTGQTVSVHDHAIWIDGRYWGRFWIAPWIMQKHIPVDAPWFRDGHSVDGTWVIPSGEVLLLGTEPYSFDGRYWGFLKDSSIGMMATAI